MIDVVLSVNQRLSVGEVAFFSFIFLVLMVLIITFYVEWFWR